MFRKLTPWALVCVSVACSAEPDAEQTRARESGLAPCEHPIPGEAGTSSDGQAPSSDAGVDASRPRPSTTPIFRMNCGTGGSSYPACGFEHQGGDTQYYTMTRLPGGSPSGSDAIQLDLIPTTEGRQFDITWAQAPETNAIAQGSVRYIRYRIQIVGPVDWRSSYNDPQGMNRLGTKHAVLGNLCERAPYGPTRVISNIGSSTGTPATVFWRTEQNIAGPPSRFDISPIVPDVWHNVQIKIQSSSTRSTADGMLYQYIDAANQSESTPTAQSSGGFVLSTAGWTRAEGCADSGIFFGGAAMSTLAPGGHAAFRIADFEYDDAFDPNWGRP
jgi:hypothetical protein